MYIYNINGNIKKEEWYTYNELGRDNDLPACIKYDDDGNIISKEWYWYYSLDRPIENGPARIKYDKGKIVKEEYYLRDKLIKKSINNNIINELNKLDETNILKCLEILKLMEK
jgi:hypothetical protein